MTITPPTMVHYADYQKVMAKIASLRAELATANTRIEHMSKVLVDAEELLGVEETGELILRPIERLKAEIASLRTELDLEKGLRSTLLANWQADTERKETAARQDAEEKSRLLEALKPFAELGAKASGNGKYALVEVAHCQSAALACRPQGEKS